MLERLEIVSADIMLHSTGYLLSIHIKLNLTIGACHALIVSLVAHLQGLVLILASSRARADSVLLVGIFHVAALTTADHASAVWSLHSAVTLAVLSRT